MRMGWAIQTRRLIIRRALPCRSDVSLLLDLWNDPIVMTNVGFPLGLRKEFEDIEEQLRNQRSDEYDCVLTAAFRTTSELIGECKLGYPDKRGAAQTDIKLLPRHWGKGYGKEVKLALLDYLFNHTDCSRVRATPNQNNVISIKLQESVGGRKTGEGVYRFPDDMKDFTNDVPYYEFTVSREDWVEYRKKDRL